MKTLLPSLPLFSKVNPATVPATLDAILAENRQALDALLATDKPHTYASLILPLEAMSAKLGDFWSPVRHLNAVMNNAELRAAYNDGLPKISNYYTELGQNEKLYQAILNLKNSAEFKNFQYPEQKYIENELRDFRLSGVALPPAQKKIFADLQEELSQLSNTFEEHVLDATNAWSLLITDEKKLRGIPEHALNAARAAAEAAEKQGWLLTLQIPCYLAVITHADDRDLRQTIYTAYTTRASDQGPQAKQFDNTEIMAKIVQKRHEMAELLSFKNYAELSLATKMAKSPETVLDFLHDLAKRARKRGEQEWQELQHFAREQHGIQQLQSWDVAYYSEKLCQHAYAIDSETLRPYFPVETVLAGMFSLTEKLFGMRISLVPEADVWHESIRCYAIHDQQDQLRGIFYTDLFARASKRGGAWMDDCRQRRMDAAGKIVTPIAFLNCNFAAPNTTQPSLLTHDEASTLFHEFGHTIHHLLTQIACAGVSGINGVAWDAVELPSQFMEEWCWQRPVLDLIAKHYQTGEALPEVLLERMFAARHFQSGLQLLRQIEFSLFDFRLYQEYQPGQPAERIQSLLNEVRDEVAIIKPPAFNRFQHGFAHIFSGGYAAGYYSYKWAEVLSADAFSLFEENGIFDPETGKLFLHTILEQGGARDADELFHHFRGRAPKIDALLKSTGILSDTVDAG